MIRFVKEEEKYFIDSGRFYHFLLIDVTDAGLKFTVYNTDTKAVHDSWFVPKPKNP